MMSYSWRDTNEYFAVEQEKPKKVDAEELLHYWHPDRFGVQHAPERFRQQVKAIHQDLDVTWHPVIERWLVWYKRDRITHWLSPGWLLLFVVEDAQTRYIPLDERVLAAIYEVSERKWGNGKQYWERIQAEKARDKERTLISDRQHAADVAGEFWDYTLIKNIGHGSKFANHHSE